MERAQPIVLPVSALQAAILSSVVVASSPSSLFRLVEVTSLTRRRPCHSVVAAAAAALHRIFNASSGYGVHIDPDIPRAVTIARLGRPLLRRRRCLCGRCNRRCLIILIIIIDIIVITSFATHNVRAGSICALPSPPDRDAAAHAVSGLGSFLDVRNSSVLDDELEVEQLDARRHLVEDHEHRVHEEHVHAHKCCHLNHQARSRLVELVHLVGVRVHGREGSYEDGAVVHEELEWETLHNERVALLNVRSVVLPLCVCVCVCVCERIRPSITRSVSTSLVWYRRYGYDETIVRDGSEQSGGGGGG